MHNKDLQKVYDDICFVFCIREHAAALCVYILYWYLIPIYIYIYTSSNYHYFHTHIFSSERIFHRSSPVDWPFGSTVIIERTMNDCACTTTTTTTTATSNPRATPCEPHCLIHTYYTAYIHSSSSPSTTRPHCPPRTAVFIYFSFFT